MLSSRTISTLRRNDYSLDSDQRLLQHSFASFFARKVSTERVRKSEPVGYDAALWRDLVALGVPSMGISEQGGGGGATLVDLALVAEEFGRAIAPAPLIERIVAGRLLARAGGQADASCGVIGDPSITLALSPVDQWQRQLVPAGAISDGVLALDGDDLVLLTSTEPHAFVPNLGSAPLAWWDLPADRLNRLVLEQGPRARQLFAEAVDEWKLLSAAACVGLGEAALFLGVEFAKTRRTHGVPIGSLQGIAFPLADARILLSGAQNLTRKAAWLRDNEPGDHPDIVRMAYVYAYRAANVATKTSVHVHGGLGVSVEADITLYFRRAKGWALLAGDPTRDVAVIGKRLLERASGRSSGSQADGF